MASSKFNYGILQQLFRMIQLPLIHKYEKTEDFTIKNHEYTNFSLPQYAESISIETHSDVYKYEKITELAQNTHESWELTK